MKEIVLESFRNTLKEIQLLNSVIKNDKPRKEELFKALKRAKQLLFSSYSSLNIFDESVKNYISVGHKFSLFEKIKKKKINKTEVKLIYNNLLSLLSSEIDNNIINPRTKIHLEHELFYVGFTLYSAQINEELIEFNKSLSIANLKKEELKNILLKYYKEIIQFVEDILLYDIFIIFDKPKLTHKREYMSLRSKDYKKEYIQKWVDGSVESMDIYRNKRIDHWEEIYRLDLKSDKLEEIEKLQIKLFNEFVKNRVDSEIEDIKELENQNRFKIIKSYIELIEAFFKGDTSKVVIKRLKNIFDFKKPKEVLLEYDNLLRDRLILSDFTIYEVGSSRFSTTFIASFFIEYLKDLKTLILKENTIHLVKKSKKAIKHNSFTYTKLKFGSNNLTDLRDSLKRKKFIAEDTDLRLFKKVFSGQEIEKPIIWTGNISELSYFIKQLHNNLKYVENVKQEIWAVTINCFIQENKEKYNRTKLRTQKVPATSKKIDSALKTLR